MCISIISKKILLLNLWLIIASLLNGDNCDFLKDKLTKLLLAINLYLETENCSPPPFFIEPLEST